MGDFINVLAKSVASGLSSFASQSAGAAARANAVSKQAQTDQGNFNAQQAAIANSIGADRLAEQYAFNSGAAASANDFSREMWERTALFNHEEAEIQRQWQEHMRDTAYQAAVKDMSAAGLNPILAVTGGGIQTGSGGGSAASMGTIQGAMASGGVMNGISSSESSYSGQMEYMGGMLGLMSAIISGIATAYKTASQMPAGEQFITSLMEFMNDDNSKYARIADEAKGKFQNIFDQEFLEPSKSKYGQRGRGPNNR